MASSVNFQPYEHKIWTKFSSRTCDHRNSSPTMKFITTNRTNAPSRASHWRISANLSEFCQITGTNPESDLSVRTPPGVPTHNHRWESPLLPYTCTTSETCAPLSRDGWGDRSDFVTMRTTGALCLRQRALCSFSRRLGAVDMSSSVGRSRVQAARKPVPSLREMAKKALGI